MNNFSYKIGNRIKTLHLDIGTYSPISLIETELIDSTVNLDPRLASFIASPNGDESRFFFSSRASKLEKKFNYRGKDFNYIEIKGCGKPFYGILPEYFLEDGRDLDLVQDPIGGFSLEKAVAEWNLMKKFQDLGIKTFLPLMLIRIRYIKGPKGENLALLVRTGESNIRLGYLNPQKFKGVLGKNREAILEQVLFDVGDSVRRMHDNGVCHNALHEENITLNGEIVDLEYSSEFTPEKKHRDLWYVMLSFAEVFGVPLNFQQFIKGYNKKKKKLILDSKPDDLERNIKDIALLL